jgi:flagellar basal-body rod protein FlgF
MDRMLYLAMSAAKQTMQAQSQATNNLANASTVGFKADFDSFRSMPLFGEGFPTRVFALQERPGTDFNPGTIETTGNELDEVLGVSESRVCQIHAAALIRLKSRMTDWADHRV